MKVVSKWVKGFNIRPDNLNNIKEKYRGGLNSQEGMANLLRGNSKSQERLKKKFTTLAIR